MKKVKVKDVIIGDGVPKICVSISEKTKKDILNEAAAITALKVDLVEWRVDWFENAFDLKKVEEVLKELAYALNNTPLLFTFRTANEGGEKVIDTKAYLELNKAVIASGLVDLIDVEAYIGDKTVNTILERAHEADVKVVVSNHNFEGTPPKEEIIKRLRRMQDLGADILKMAVMPKNKIDVLELLEATAIMSEKYADKPIITVSMSDMGALSRITGEIFGSAVTFGAYNKLSAPGQIKLEDLHKALQLLHRI
ncbi:type I 3-dehydroquinate dehydratase [Candidatus Clostridium radicumherbarum]|uniref:3-dehydroquinate dehydratase n=1 Tax=Candidatus Clostridium radicumherbarum TaxID=3381662 RepID=A0ABW8TWR5_9CLOT